jgi:hypothetical protein
MDLTGQRFGRLVVVSRAGSARCVTRITSTGAKWDCLCDCGRTKAMRGNDLRSGSSTSCGRGECRPATKPSGLGMARAIYAAYRCRARGRAGRPTPKRTFELTFEQFLELTAQPCTYCGRPPETSAWNGKMNGAFVYNGLDRVDNDLGYTLDNVVACCGRCNLMKRDLSAGDFIDQCRRIAERSRG